MRPFFFDRPGVSIESFVAKLVTELGGCHLFRPAGRATVFSVKPLEA